MRLFALPCLRTVILFGKIGVLGLSVASCAVVDEIDRDGTRRRAIAFGAIPVTNSSPDRARSIAATGLGLHVQNDGLTIGFFNDLMIVPDAKCQIVLIGSSDEQLENFARLMGNKQPVCNATRMIGADQ
jgi:hypothetical protein